MTEKSAQIFIHYKNSTGLTNQKLAQLFGISLRSIIKYLKGSPVHPKTALKIQQITRGQILAIDLLDPNSLPGKQFLKKNSGDLR